MSDIPPIRAVVRPRVLSDQGDSLLLEDEVARLLDSGTTGFVQLAGEPGSGRTTALQHLAAVFAGSERLELIEDLVWHPSATSRLVLFTRSSTGFSPSPETPRTTLTLAPWTQDEVIEYLLARHREQCKAVMSRLNVHELQWVPVELWVQLLDRLAGDPTLANPWQALSRHLNDAFPDSPLRQHLESASLESVINPKHGLIDVVIDPLPLLNRDRRLLRLPSIRLMLAALRIHHEVRASEDCETLTKPLPRPLLKAVGRALSEDRPALVRLRTLASTSPLRQAMAASLLHEAGETWLPPEHGSPPVLDDACLEGVDWPNVNLKGASLKETDLSRANLRGANLSECHAPWIVLNGADLRRARLEKFLAFDGQFRSADLSGAIATGAAFSCGRLQRAAFNHASLKDACFTGASLDQAVFRNADLTGAVLLKCSIDDVDFSHAVLDEAKLNRLPLRRAVLTGASFRHTRLRECDLQGVDLDGTNLEAAILDGSDLTGASFARANFAGASLQNTGLADVNFEGACLRAADLRDATFHLGSSRSGLLFTPIASEGTRTGFYTDEYGEQTFQTPEDIRKANLRFADLREAQIDDVDFYLVDLRGALYDEHQEAHFRRCRAILDDWSGG